MIIVSARDTLVARLRLLRLLYTGGRCPRTKLAIMRASVATHSFGKNSEVVLVEDLVYPRGNRGYWLRRVPSILLGRSILLHIQLFYLTTYGRPMCQWLTLEQAVLH